MARNGSGTYTLPSNSFNPAVVDTTIDQDDWNTTATDIETALTGSIAKDGQTPTTAVIPFANGVKTDTVVENTSNTGVTVDSVLLKDGGITLGTSGTVIFEGSTADDFETTLTVTDPTADRTVTLPNATTTLVGTDTTDTLTNKTLTSAVLNTGVSGTAVLDEDNMASDSATQLATQQSIKAYVDGAVDNSLPKNYITGLQISNDTDADHDISITPGEARGSDDDEDIVLSSTIVKRIDATWSSGTGNGGLSSSLTAPAADTWYHVHAIMVGGSADVGFDTSATAANLVTDHTATAYRRLGSVLTDSSSNIIGFWQDGDDFGWTDPSSDYSADPGTSEVTTTLTVPTGVSVRASLAAYQQIALSGNVTARTAIYHPDTAGAATDAILAGDTPGGSGVGGRSAANIWVRTNTSAQVQHISEANVGTLTLITMGWMDDRGRNS